MCGGEESVYVFLSTVALGLSISQSQQKLDCLSFDMPELEKPYSRSSQMKDANPGNTSAQVTDHWRNPIQFNEATCMTKMMLLINYFQDSHF